MKRIIALVAAAITLAACDDTPRPMPEFREGQFVTAKISGHRGMVQNIWCSKVRCYYDVRFPSLQIRTNTHMFGNDGPVTFAPVTLVRMRGFELEPAP